jgi:hypothetical protein
VAALEQQENALASGMLGYYGAQQQSVDRELAANQFALPLAVANAQALYGEAEDLRQAIADDEARRQIAQDKATKEEQLKALQGLKIPVKKIAEPPPYIAPPNVPIPERPTPRPTALGSLFAAIAGIVAPESAGAIAASNIKGAIDAAAQSYQDALQKRQMILDAALRQWEAVKEHMHDLHAFQQAQYDADFERDLKKLDIDSAIASTKAELKGLGVAENLENATGIKRRALAAKLATLETAKQYLDLLKSNIDRLTSLDEKLEGYKKDVMLQVLKAVEERAKEANTLDRQIIMENKRTEDREALYRFLQPLLLEKMAFGQAVMGQRQITVGEKLAQIRGQSRGVDLKGKAAVDTSFGGVSKALSALHDTRIALGIVRAKDTDPGAPEFARIQKAEMAADGATNVFVQKAISFMRGNIQRFGPSAVTVNADALRDYGQRLAALLAQGQIPPYDFARVMSALVSNAKALNLIPKVWNLPTFSEGELQMMSERLMPALRNRDTNIPYQHLMQMLSADPSQWDSILAGYQSQPMKNLMKKLATLYHEMALGAPVTGTAQAQGEGLSKDAINAIRTSLGAPPIK